VSASWDDTLCPAMQRRGVAIHEELLVHELVTLRAAG
jgi:hypothetical protein